MQRPCPALPALPFLERCFMLPVQGSPAASGNRQFLGAALGAISMLPLTMRTPPRGTSPSSLAESPALCEDEAPSLALSRRQGEGEIPNVVSLWLLPPPQRYSSLCLAFSWPSPSRCLHSCVLPQPLLSLAPSFLDFSSIVAQLTLIFLLFVPPSF